MQIFLQILAGIANTPPLPSIGRGIEPQTPTPDILNTGKIIFFNQNEKKTLKKFVCAFDCDTYFNTVFQIFQTEWKKFY